MSEPNRAESTGPETPRGDGGVRSDAFSLSAGTIGGLGLSSAFGPVLPTPKGPAPTADFAAAEARAETPAATPTPGIAGYAGSGAAETPSIAGRIEPTPVREEESAASPGSLVESLLHAGHRLRGTLDSKFAGLKLSDARFVALKVIRESAPHGCTQAHLAGKLGQCESSISTLVERMRASQLLYRLRSKSDRRKRVLMLTEEGRRLLEEATVVYEREAERVLGHIDVGRRMTFAELLEALATGLDRADDGHEGVRRAA